MRRRLPWLLAIAALLLALGTRPVRTTEAPAEEGSATPAPQVPPVLQHPTGGPWLQCALLHVAETELRESILASTQVQIPLGVEQRIEIGDTDRGPELALPAVWRAGTVALPGQPIVQVGYRVVLQLRTCGAVGDVLAVDVLDSHKDHRSGSGSGSGSGSLLLPPLGLRLDEPVVWYDLRRGIALLLQATSTPEPDHRRETFWRARFAALDRARAPLSDAERSALDAWLPPRRGSWRAPIWAPDPVGQSLLAGLLFRDLTLCRAARPHGPAWLARMTPIPAADDLWQDLVRQPLDQMDEASLLALGGATTQTTTLIDDSDARRLALRALLLQDDAASARWIADRLRPHFRTNRLWWIVLGHQEPPATPAATPVWHELWRDAARQLPPPWNILLPTPWLMLLLVLLPLLLAAFVFAQRHLPGRTFGLSRPALVLLVVCALVQPGFTLLPVFPLVLFWHASAWLRAGGRSVAERCFATIAVTLAGMAALSALRWYPNHPVLDTLVGSAPLIGLCLVAWMVQDDPAWRTPDRYLAFLLVLVAAPLLAMVQPAGGGVVLLVALVVLATMVFEGRAPARTFATTAMV